MLRNAILPAALLALARAQDQPDIPDDKPTLFPDGLGDELGALGELEGKPFNIHQWEHGVIPESCRFGSEQDYCSTYDYEVFDVNIDDCDRPWIVCRCNNAEAPIERVADKLSRLPIGAREYIRYVHVYEGASSALAYFSLGDLYFFGPADSQTVYIHETSHNLDWWVAPPDGEQSSAGDKWRNTVTDNECVADNYARSSYAEAYAQAGVMVAYDVNVGPIGEVRDPGCMRGGFDQAREEIGGIWGRREGQCESRIDDDENVCMGPDVPCPLNNGQRKRDTSHIKSLKPPVVDAETQVAVDELIAHNKREAEIKAGIGKAAKRNPIKSLHPTKSDAFDHIASDNFGSN